MKISVKCCTFLLLLSALLFSQKESNSSEDSESNTVQATSPQKEIQNNLLIDKNKSMDTVNKIAVDPTLINDLPSILEIVTIPDSAFIILDDKLQGKSPQIIGEVTPGKHTIVLKKTGYFAKKVTINVPPGIEKKLEFTMEKPSILTITSEPKGSTVYLNKEDIGSTPVQSKQLKKGNYNLILLKEGYQKNELNHTLEAGKRDSLHIILKVKPGVESDLSENEEEPQQKENSKVRSVLDKIALGIFAGFSLIILLIELSQDN